MPQSATPRSVASSSLKTRSVSSSTSSGDETSDSEEDSEITSKKELHKRSQSHVLAWFELAFSSH